MSTAADLRARILASANPKPVPVDTTLWGRVWVRILTCADVEEVKSKPDDKMRIARGVARVLCDESGVLLFDPGSEDDVAAVASLPWAELNSILTQAEGTKVPAEGGGQGNVSSRA